MPVATTVLAHALRRPGAVALRSPERRLTYAELAAAVRSVATALTAQEMPRAAMVAVDLPDPVDTMVTMLGADLARAVPLICDASWPAASQAAVLDAVGPDLHITEVPGTDAGRPDAGGALGTSRARALRPRAPDGADLAWAGFSSGSTGRPRAIVRTRASWTSSFPVASALCGLTEEATVLVPGPLASSLYCFAATHGLAAGAEVIVTGRWSPSLVAPFLGAADVIHLVPAMLDRLLDDLPRTSRLRTAMVGGAALPDRTRRRAVARGLDVVAYYGAVELAFVAVDTDGHGLRPFDEVEVELRPVADGAGLSEIWVRSPWVAEHYLAGATGPFRRDAAGWASVGDLAEAGPGGRLVLRGRADGAVNTAGATVIPEDVESVLREVPDVADIVVVATPHPQVGEVLTAVVEVAPGAANPRAALERVARSHLSAAQRPRRWFATDLLPRTTTGKPARAATAAACGDGSMGIRPLPRGADD